MKMNKKQAARLVWMVCAVLLLLLNACSRRQEATPTEPVPSEQTLSTTETAAIPTEETTEETTEATEETTEATEEATEESTEPTGNTRPGGTSGYNPGLGGNTGTNPPVTNPTPAPGSEGSPYLEILTQSPESFSTVAIPAGGTVYQSVLGAGNTLLTIEDADAYVVYNEQTFEPDENGIVSVDLAAPETEGAPVVVQVGNKNAEAKAFSLSFLATLGTQHNPEPVIAEEGVISIQTALEAEDEDGYFYSYTAEEEGRLILSMDILTESAVCDLVVTVDETELKLSESEDGVIAVELKEEQTVIFQIVVLPGEDGTIPAAEVRISGMVESAPGTSTNPIIVMGEFPIVTDTIEPGASVFYSVMGADTMMLKVEDPDACITVDGVTYAPVEGVISAQITAEDPRMPVSIVVGNSGEEAKSFTVELIPPVGSQSNPADLAEGENIASLEAGDTDGYWFRWSADSEAQVTVTMPEGSWMYSVTHTSGDTVTVGDTHWSDDDPVVNSCQLTVAYGDVIDVMVNTYDPADMFSNPAGDIVFDFQVVRYLDVTHAGATLELAPGETIFCKAMIRAENVILNIVGDGQFAVHMEGVDYASVDGRVRIEGIETNFYEPKQFSVTNSSEVPVTCTLSYENPVGTSGNPDQILEMGSFTCQVNGNGEGYFYEWIAASDGTLTLTMTCDDWAYTINNRTSYQYGSNHVSSFGDPPTESITVKTGDRIEINLGTASWEKKQVSFELSFQPAEEASLAPESTEPSSEEPVSTEEAVTEGTEPDAAEPAAGTEPAAEDVTEATEPAAVCEPEQTAESECSEQEAPGEALEETAETEPSEPSVTETPTEVPETTENPA